MRSAAMLLVALAVALALVASSADALSLHDRVHHTHHRNERNDSSPLKLSATSCSVNGLSGDCISISSCQALNDHTSVPNHCPGGDDIECCLSQPEASPGCGTAALKRALTWVQVDLQYCQSANGARDYDSSCSEYCSRAHNRKWDAYRSDCSGFVSYAYGLGAPGRVTGEFAPYTTDISYKLGSPKDLEPGDAINSTPSEHIMIFHSWLNSDKTKARFYEEPGCSPAVHWARQTDSDVSIDEGKGTIHVAENGMNFFPIRFFSNKDVC